MPDVQRFEAELLDFLRTRHGDVLEGIRTSGAMGDEDRLKDLLQSFADDFAPSSTSADEA